MFTNLKKAAIAEIEKRYATIPADFRPTKDKDSGRDIEPRACRLLDRPWNAKPYKGTAKAVNAKIRARIEKLRAERIAEKIAKIEKIEAAPERLNNHIIIKIDWTRNRTWGYTARGSDNFGNVSDIVSGCGYDKPSTATAEVLNQHPSILRKMYAAADKDIAKGQKARKGNRENIGYGSGYGTLPYFEGGVGVSCHVKILEALGYSVTWGNDVLVITEK